jgi:hypothetical protein
MTHTQPATLSPRPPGVPGDAAATGSAGAPSSVRLALAERPGAEAASSAEGPAWLAAPGGAGAGWTVAPRASRPAGGPGYAPPPAPGRAGPAAAASKPPKPPSGGTSAPKASPSGEWAFLSDPHLSIEEKLFRFMLLVQKKTDEELTKKMQDYRAKHVTGGSGGGRSSTSGLDLLGVAKRVIDPLGLVGKLLGGKDGGILGQALQGLGGPLLAALATAVGLPHLAPAALELGGQLGGIAAQAVGSAVGATGGGAKAESAGSARKESGTPDERLALLEIQRLVEKQNQMFTLVSNILKGMHEAGMAAVHNVR